MASLTSFDEIKSVFNTLSDRAESVVQPTLRLGVTGLSRAGKTVFITALVRALTEGGRLPLFKLRHENRILSAQLEQQPDDDLPRFEYEKHLDTILHERLWPQSTRALSQLRLTVKYRPHSRFGRYFNRGQLTIDLIDYPGEWLLDLPLLEKDYRQFSQDSFARAKAPHHCDLAKQWLGFAHSVNVLQKADEQTIENLAQEFTNYLKIAKADQRALSMLPPGRFLMPGEYAGAPLLTFAPLPLPENTAWPENSLAAIMERRYESYKQHIVKPFFTKHITRLDRQIILIDAMQALNSGHDAVDELKHSLSDILACFRTGHDHWLGRLFRHRIDRILVASTKADQLHHVSHEHLQNLTRQLVEEATLKAGLSGSNVGSLALASIRSTHEAEAHQNGTTLPVIIGTPMADENINGVVFDGKTETAIFPGDLPYQLDEIGQTGALRFIRFRPPVIKKHETLPHIRLDRALEFLIGDQFA